MITHNLSISNRYGIDLPARVYAVQLEDVDMSGASALLDRDEMAYANKITHAEARKTFVKSRAALRAVLSREIGIAPAKIPLKTGPHGKPELADNDDMHFNLSHSSGMALIAIHTRPIGVDIEFVDERIADFDLAADLFTATEQTQVDQAGVGTEKTRQFFRIWTRKEALLKGLGMGFDADPRSFDVAEDREPKALGWQLHPLPVAQAWEAAIAVADPEADVHMVDVVSFQPFRVKRRKGAATPAAPKARPIKPTLH